MWLERWVERTEGMTVGGLLGPMIGIAKERRRFGERRRGWMYSIMSNQGKTCYGKTHLIVNILRRNPLEGKRMKRKNPLDHTRTNLRPYISGIPAPISISIIFPWPQRIGISEACQAVYGVDWMEDRTHLLIKWRRDGQPRKMYFFLRIGQQ